MKKPSSVCESVINEKLTFLLLAFCAIISNTHASSATVKQQCHLNDLGLNESTFWAFPVLNSDGCFEMINIPDEIGSNLSKRFGIQLLGAHRAQWVMTAVKENPDIANILILMEWIIGNGIQPVTSSKLIDVLRDIGLSELAEKMRVSFETLKLMDTHYRPSVVMEYSKVIANSYDNCMKSVVKLSRWPTVSYINLDLEERGSKILMTDLLHDTDIGLRILLFGRPGAGKSTLTCHLSKMLTEMFYLIVRVDLTVNKQIDSLATMLKINSDRSLDSKIDEIVEYIEKTRGNGVCFLLDGFDKYIETVDTSDYVRDLISKHTLTESVVLLTSRPSATESIRDHFNRTVEVAGFGEDGIKCYLEQINLSQAKKNTIKDYFDTHPNVKQLCYLPLHLSMLVYIADSDIDSLSHADTETKLYTSFLLLTIKHYRHVRHEHSIESLKECWEDGASDLCLLLKTVSKIAYDGLKNREQTFTFEALPANLTAEIEALSLFKAEPIHDGRGNILYNCTYSHATFQEFLAALHLITLPKLLYEDYYFLEVYKFYLGLIGSEFQYDEKTVLKEFIKFARRHLYLNAIFVMKCAHEIGRSSHFITYLRAVGLLTNSNSLQVFVPYLFHNCWYINYTLTQYPVSEVMVEDSYFELLGCITKLRIEPEIVPITRLTLGSLHTLHSFPNSTSHLLAFQNKLVQLQIFFIVKDIDIALSLLETLKQFKKLQSLTLRVAINVIKEDSFEIALSKLHLDHLHLVIDDFIPTGNFILEFKHIPDVNDNETALLSGLKYMTGLKSFSITMCCTDTYTDDVRFARLIEGIKQLPIDTDLTLNCASHFDPINYMKAIFKLKSYGSIRKNFTLYTELHKGFKTQLTGDIKAKFKLFKSFGSTLKNLTLYVLTEPCDVIELGKGLQELNQLFFLHLEVAFNLQTNETLDDVAAITLADGLKHLQNLRVLDFHLLFSVGDKSITNEILRALKQLRQLRRLHFSGMRIADDDVPLLAEALDGMNQLHTLDLSFNEVGDVGAIRLTESNLTHLQVLILNNNLITKDGARVLFERLPNVHIEVSVVNSYVFRLELLEQLNSTDEVYPAGKLDPTDEKCLNVNIMILLLCLSALIGVVIPFCYKLSPLTSKTKMHRGIFSDSLTLDIFSASYAWKLEGLELDGSGTVIAILDTSIDLSYPAFHHNNVVVYDCLPGVPVVSTEHGSVCAAVAVGSPFNTATASVPRGIAPGAHLILFRIADGSQPHCTTEAVLNALDMIRSNNETLKINVVSISYDLADDDRSIAVLYERIQRLTAMGIAVIAAAGNRGNYQAELSIPARFDNVISVGALDENGFPASFNPRGYIDVYAPGKGIDFSGIKYSGSSFAAPVIAGVVSLLKQRADEVGPPARDHILKVNVLRAIFKRYMITVSDDNKEVFDPVGFFKRVLNNAISLNEIVREINESEHIMDTGDQ